MKALWLLLLTGLASAMQAQSTKIEYTAYDLPNGLHVILHQDATVPTVAVTVMYHVGSKNENPNRTGFAHFFEHLMFEGTENIGPGEYDRYVQNAGGQLNANTTYDRTFYYELLPSNQLALGLWLESERMLHAKVETKGIETQRQVVKEERRQRIDNQPYGTLLEETMKRSFTTHPYQWSVIGSMAHLDAAQTQDYVDFYHQFYVPNNAILSIAGNIDIAETKKLVEQYFGSIPKGTKPVYRPSVREPAPTKQVRDTFFDNIQLPAVVLTYRTPPQGTPDYYAANMVAQILSQGASSRFQTSLVDKQELSAYAGSFPIGLEDDGVNISFAIAAPGVDAGKLEEAMNAEIDKLIAEGISDEEFIKLRNQIETDFVNQNATVAGRAENLANYHMYFGDSNLINEEINRYMKVTRADVQAAAKKYFDKNRRVVLYYLPKTAQP
jgi:zinc protease